MHPRFSPSARSARATGGYASCTVSVLGAARAPVVAVAPAFLVRDAMRQRAMTCQKCPRVSKLRKSRMNHSFHSADRSTHRVIGSACVQYLYCTCLASASLPNQSNTRHRHLHSRRACQLRRRTAVTPSFGNRPLGEALSANFLVAVPAVRLPRSETLPSCDPT